MTRKGLLQELKIKEDVLKILLISKVGDYETAVNELRKEIMVLREQLINAR